jgi:hypothetical protein
MATVTCAAAGLGFLAALGTGGPFHLSSSNQPRRGRLRNGSPDYP